MEGEQFSVSDEKNSENRYSRRVRRKPQPFIPEPKKPRNYNPDISVTVKIESTGGFKKTKNSHSFSAFSSFNANQLLAKIVKNLGMNVKQKYMYAYFDEAKQSKSYSEWKSIKGSQRFAPGGQYKVRIIKKAEKFKTTKDRQVAYNTETPSLPPINYQQFPQQLPPFMMFYYYYQFWTYWMNQYCAAVNYK